MFIIWILHFNYFIGLYTLTLCTHSKERVARVRLHISKSLNAVPAVAATDDIDDAFDAVDEQMGELSATSVGKAGKFAQVKSSLCGRYMIVRMIAAEIEKDRADTYVGTQRIH